MTRVRVRTRVGLGLMPLGLGLVPVGFALELVKIVRTWTREYLSSLF